MRKEGRNRDGRERRNAGEEGRVKGLQGSPRKGESALTRRQHKTGEQALEQLVEGRYNGQGGRHHRAQVTVASTPFFCVCLPPALR